MAEKRVINYQNFQFVFLTTLIISVDRRNYLSPGMLISRHLVMNSQCKQLSIFLLNLDQFLPVDTMAYLDFILILKIGNVGFASL